MFATVIRLVQRTGFVKHYSKIGLLELDTVSSAELDYNEGNEAKNTDVSNYASFLPKTFNLAAYINKSEVLKMLTDMNVNLSNLEKKQHLFHRILKLEYNQVQNHIFFLSNIINMEDLPKFLSTNPSIFTESMSNLDVRINYLVAKKFHQNQIKRIVTNNPYWLMFNTTRIDRRLGFFQDYFKLNGDQVRELATKNSKIITYNIHHIKTNSFVIKEEMGFEDNEIKQLILKKPKLWLMNQKTLLQRFSYLHNVMKISHEKILLCPQILECRLFRLKQRDIFLKQLGKAQYDPKKENYVPLIALVENSDKEFCKIHAKCNIGDFNAFLKTM